MHVYVCVCERVYARVCVCVCVHMCVCVHVYVGMYVLDISTFSYLMNITNIHAQGVVK